MNHKKCRPTNNSGMVAACAVGVGLLGVHAAAVGSALEEVVVTAQKRSESLQDVPVSVTSFSGDDIKVKRIRAAEDLAMHIPNLQVATPIGDGVPVFSLRGISMTDFSLSQSSPIATYYDEVYKGTWVIQGLAMYDLERVEVLKGPQGTLYGKNTTGGAVNFIARKPEFETGGYLTLGYGRFSHRSVEGAFETPITDSLAVRLALTWDKSDGYMKNPLPGKKDLNDQDQYALRATLRYQPQDSVDIVLRASTSNQESNGFGVSPIPGPGGVADGLYGLFGLPGYSRERLDKREHTSMLDTRRDMQSHAVSLHATFELGNDLTFGSITSWDTGEIDFVEDADGTPLVIADGFNFADATQVTQDFRLTSNYSGPFNFILGAYYSKEDVDAATDLVYFGDIDANADNMIDGEDCIAGGFFFACQYGNSFEQEKISYALYSDITFDISQRATVRGGLRYTHDKLALDDFIAQIRSVNSVPIVNTIPGNYTGPIDATTSRRINDDNISGKIGIDYRFSDDVMVYGSVSRGYRAAAFNAQAYALPEELTVADPEEVDAYELGLKSEFFDRKLRLNAALFRYDYTNQQVLNVDPQTQAQVLISLPESEITGVEFDINYAATSNLLLSLSGGFLDTEIIEGEFFGIDIKGNELLSSPSRNLTASFDWSLPLADWGHADFRVDASYVSEYHYDLVNSTAATEDNYTLVNTQLRLQPENEKYSLTLWAKNLTDTFYAPIKYDVLDGLGFVYRQVNRPRTYGVTLSMEF